MNVSIKPSSKLSFALFRPTLMLKCKRTRLFGLRHTHNPSPSCGDELKESKVREEFNAPEVRKELKAPEMRGELKAPEVRR